MKRILLTEFSILITWTFLDILAHRLFLRQLYESNPCMWRPFTEMNPALVSAITLLLVTVFLATYKQLIHPKSLTRGICFGTLLGLALGGSAGFGTYIHSPIPLALAWGWFILGTLKGIIAGIILGELIHENQNA
jgi:hypothetical protein